MKAIGRCRGVREAPYFPFHEVCMRLRADRRVERQREAVERNAKFAALSDKEKLARLDAQNGKGLGAKRQRKKLEAIA